MRDGTMRKRFHFLWFTILIAYGNIFCGLLIAVGVSSCGPEIKVGDNIVWKEYNEGEFYFDENLNGLFYNKYIITQIIDEENDTVVYADHYRSVNSKKDFSFKENREIGRYCNYSIDPSRYFVLQYKYIIIPGTKIADYIDRIKAVMEEGVQVSSIKNGYGIKIRFDDAYASITQIVHFNEEGFLFKWSYRSGNDLMLFQLYSINGDRYYIPSFPWYAILGFSIIGMIGIFLRKKREIRVC